MSALVRPHDRWTLRLSTGRGYFAPTPFTEDTDATGLTPIAPLGTVRPERGDNVSADVTWVRLPLEVTATMFCSRIRDALAVRETGSDAFPLTTVNTRGATITRGTELIARMHREGFDVITTYMFLWSTEAAPDEVGRREVPLNPRRAATFDLLKQIGPARIGFEVFYTGRQALDDNPFRKRGFPYVLYGGLIDWAVGTSRISSTWKTLEMCGRHASSRSSGQRAASTGRGRWTRGRHSKAER